jgi:hypothetical protein
MPPRQALARMREEARRALEIDPGLPEGHAMLGAAAAMFDFDWPEAERQFQKKGEVERATRLVERLKFDDGQGDPIGPAVYHLLRDELDACANWVETAIEQRQPAVFFFVHTTAKKLQSTARWPKPAALLKLPG